VHALHDPLIRRLHATDVAPADGETSGEHNNEPS